MTYLPLRIIATLLSFVGTWYLLTALNPDNSATQLDEQEISALRFLRAVVMICRAFETAVFWIL